jgi:hypothetical protein
VLAREGLAGYVDVSGHLWQGIDTSEDVERAEKLLEDTGEEPCRDGDGVVSRCVDRRVSTAVSLALYMARVFIHPNIVALIGLHLCVGSPASPTHHGRLSSPTPQGSHLIPYITAERIIQETIVGVEVFKHYSKSQVFTDIHKFKLTIRSVTASLLELMEGAVWRLRCE